MRVTLFDVSGTTVIDTPFDVSDASAQPLGDWGQDSLNNFIDPYL